MPVGTASHAWSLLIPKSSFTQQLTISTHWIRVLLLGAHASSACCSLGRVMEEKAEAQRLLDDSLQKIYSTKRALGNGEVEEHRHIDSMLHFIQNHIGISTASESVRNLTPLLLFLITLSYSVINIISICLLVACCC
jgi:hypothetical protein